VPLPVELAGKKIPIQIEAGKTIESKAAKQIGLTIPPNVLVRADKVIK
jgi:hypothetical protein